MQHDGLVDLCEGQVPHFRTRPLREEGKRAEQTKTTAAVQTEVPAFQTVLKLRLQWSQKG